MHARGLVGDGGGGQPAALHARRAPGSAVAERRLDATRRHVVNLLLHTSAYLSENFYSCLLLHCSLESHWFQPHSYYALTYCVESRV